MRRLTASLALLALPLLVGCEPSRLPLTPHFRILHSDVQQGATQAGAPVTRVVARVLVPRDSSPAALREQADGAIARLRRRYGAAAITLHITDSGLDLPLPGPQGSSTGSRRASASIISTSGSRPPTPRSTAGHRR